MTRQLTRVTPAEVLAELGYPPSFGDWVTEREALGVACPRCGARAPGYPCRDHHGTRLTRSHPERYAAVDTGLPRLGTKPVTATALIPYPAALAWCLDWPIAEIGLTVRSFNCLRRHGIITVRDLLACTEEDLMDLRWFGVACRADVRQVLERLSLT